MRHVWRSAYAMTPEAMTSPYRFRQDSLEVSPVHQPPRKLCDQAVCPGFTASSLQDMCNPLPPCTHHQLCWSPCMLSSLTSVPQVHAGAE